jgi:hypothetical protein
MKKDLMPGLRESMNKDIDLRKLVQGMSFILFVAAIGSILYFIVGPARGYFHSDCADSIYWANASVESGLPLSRDFSYAAILPFGSNLWLIPLVAMFGLKYATHVVGMIIFAALFTVALIFLASRLELKGAWRNFFVTGVLVLLSGSVKLREIMWGHVIYYSLSILFIVVGLALVLDIYSGKHKWRPLIWIALLTAGVATDNAQMIGLYLIPLLGGIWLERFFDAGMKWNDPLTQKAKRATAVMLAATVVGLFVLFILTNFGRISAGHAEAYSTYSDPEQWMENASRFIPHLLTLFGVSLKGGTSYVSPSSVINFIRIICLAVVLILPVSLFLVYRKIGNRSLKIMLWVHALTSALILFLAATGLVGLYNWRLIPMMGTAVITAIYGLKWLFEEKETSRSLIEKDSDTADRSNKESQNPTASPVRKRITAVCISIIVLQIFVTIGAICIMPPNFGKENDFHRNIAFLRSHQLDYGFATFLNAATTTVLSDNEIRVRHTEIFDNKLAYWDWQNDPGWFEDQPGVDRYFLLLSEEEYERVVLSESWKSLIEEVLETETGHYVIVFRENPWNHKDPSAEG